MRKYLVIYEEAVSLVIYDFATAAPFWISLYMRKIVFPFSSVWGGPSSDDWRKSLALCLLCGIDCKILCLRSIVRSQESPLSHNWMKSSIRICSFFKTSVVSFSSVFHVQGISKCEKRRGSDDHENSKNGK